MSAVSGSSRALSVYRQEKNQDKEEPILVQITDNEQNTFLKYLNIFESYYPIMQIGQSIGLSNPSQVAKLMPSKMSKDFFSFCFRAGFKIGMHHTSIEMDACFSGMKQALLGMMSLAEGKSLERTSILADRIEDRTETRLSAFSHDVQQALGIFFARHTAWFAAQFQAVGVCSYDQFARKSAQISLSKQQAEVRYLSHLENFIKRKRIDLCFFDRYLDSPNDHQTVARYWDFLLGREDGISIHQMVENQLKALVSDSFDKFYVVYRKLKAEARKHDCDENQLKFFDWPNKLLESILFSAKSLITFRDLALPDVSLVESYFFLKAKMALHMIGKREIRKKLAPKFEKLKADILSTRVDATTQMINYYKTVIKISEALINDTECDDPNFPQIKEAWLLQPPSERKIILIKFDGTQEEGLAPFYAALQKMEETAESTNETFLSSHFTQEQKNYHTILEGCKETSLERLFFDSYSVIWGKDVLNPRDRKTILKDIDMQCDLSMMVDPIAHFENLMSVRDDERLVLAETLTSCFVEDSSAQESFIRHKLQKQQAKEESARKSWDKAVKRANKAIKQIVRGTH